MRGTTTFRTSTRILFKSTMSIRNGIPAPSTRRPPAVEADRQAATACDDRRRRPRRERPYGRGTTRDGRPHVGAAAKSRMWCWAKSTLTKSPHAAPSRTRSCLTKWFKSSLSPSPSRTLDNSTGHHRPLASRFPIKDAVFRVRSLTASISSRFYPAGGPHGPSNLRQHGLDLLLSPRESNWDLRSTEFFRPRIHLQLARKLRSMSIRLK